MLGLLPSTDITSETLELQAGETFVLFTDGVSEALDSHGDLFGEERLLEHLRHSPGASARETTAGILAAVRSHAAGAHQSDDITIVAVRCAAETVSGTGSAGMVQEAC